MILAGNCFKFYEFECLIIASIIFAFLKANLIVRNRRKYSQFSILKSDFQTKSNLLIYFTDNRNKCTRKINVKCNDFYQFSSIHMSLNLNKLFANLNPK